MTTGTGGAYNIQARYDDGSNAAGILVATRGTNSSNITSITYGNINDNPTHTMYGSFFANTDMRINGAFAQIFHQPTIGGASGVVANSALWTSYVSAATWHFEARNDSQTNSNPVLIFH